MRCSSQLLGLILAAVAATAPATVSALASTVISIDEGGVSTVFTLPELSIPVASLTIKSPTGPPTTTVVLTLTHTSTNSIGSTVVHQYPTDDMPGISNTAPNGAPPPTVSSTPPVVTGAAAAARPALAGAVGLLGMGVGALGLAAL